MLLLTSSFLPVTALQQKTTIMHLKDAIFKYGATQKLIATLTDRDGNPLNKKVVNFYVNTSIEWHYLGSNMTDNTGTAEYTVNITMPNGTYLFKAFFNGDSEYAPSEDIAQITVVGDVAFLPILLIAGKAIAVAVAEHLIMEYVFKPYVFTPLADYVKKSSFPYKEYYDEPAEIQQYVELALLVISVSQLLKNGYKAGFQFVAAREATGKAVGGHMRWFWHYAKRDIAEFTALLTGKIIEYIDNRVYEKKGVHLTDEEKSQINQSILPFFREPNDAFLRKTVSSTSLDSFIVDPIIGYSETIKVPENVKRMRIYLGWNISEYVENSFILKDPAGNTIIPQLNVIHPSDPEATKIAVELTVWDPPAGNWILWFNGSKLPSKTVVMSIQFDKIFEIIPQYVLVNPGYTVNITAIFNNFGNTTLMASLSPKNVPAGWNVTTPPYCPIIFPNSSSTMPISVMPPPDIRYGANQTLNVEAVINGSTYLESFTVFIYPYIEIEDGIAYLHERQLSDGSWSSSVGITSLATLAFLNAGYDETYPTVKKAIQYILANRNLDGSFGSGTYETSTAVWVLVATHNPDYHDEISAAKDWLIKAQSDEEDGTPPDDLCYGGWRYGISSHDGDLSNTQFALMALDAAYTELGLKKPDPNDPNGWAFKAIKFISRCQNRPASNDQPWAHDTTQPSYNDGGFIYHPKGWSLAGGTKSYGSMTAAGIWSLRLCGVDVNDGRIQNALKWLAKNEDGSFDDNPGHPYDQPRCFLYYYYLTLAKALTMCFLQKLGEVDWYNALSTKLIDLQCNDGHWVNAPASHGWEDNPDLATSYAILSLQVRWIPAAIKSLSWLTIILRSNADLHVYDPLGRHVGKNYETGKIEIQIPNATYIYDEFQNITIPELESGNYRIVLVGIGTGSYTLNVTGGVGNITVSKYSYTGNITKREVHGSVVNVAMITWLTIHVERARALGDINGDGIVDYKDLAIMCSCYGTKAGDLNFRSEADLNNDGYIDYKDLAILISNYGRGTS
jgi:squalene-hopene/tetraprenyl-beta-curcumene cyclase